MDTATPAAASTTELTLTPDLADRRQADLGPPPRTSERRVRERRIRHRTPSGLVATDGLKMSCPCCGASESAVVKTTGRVECPSCGEIMSDVVKVRGLIDADAVRRRRECASCGTRFPTWEVVDQARLQQQADAHGISPEKYKTAP